MLQYILFAVNTNVSVRHDIRYLANRFQDIRPDH